MVRKAGHTTWTNLGGKPEGNETEEAALLREIQEEFDCGAKIIKKLGDFTAKAAQDNALVKLSAYLVDLKGEIHLIDSELEEYRYIGKDYKAKGIKFPLSIEKYILPYCIKEGLLNW